MGNASEIICLDNSRISTSAVYIEVLLVGDGGVFFGENRKMKNDTPNNFSQYNPVCAYLNLSKSRCFCKLVG